MSNNAKKRILYISDEIVRKLTRDSIEAISVPKSILYTF